MYVEAKKLAAELTSKRWALAKDPPPAEKRKADDVDPGACLYFCSVFWNMILTLGFEGIVEPVKKKQIKIAKNDPIVEIVAPVPAAPSPALPHVNTSSVLASIFTTGSGSGSTPATMTAVAAPAARAKKGVRFADELAVPKPLREVKVIKLWLWEELALKEAAKARSLRKDVRRPSL